MRNTLLVFMLFAMLVSRASAKEGLSNGAPDFSSERFYDRKVVIGFNSAVIDKYIVNNGEVAYDKPVVQSQLSVSFRSGFYLDFWNSTPLEEQGLNLGSEQDYGIGFERSLSALGLPSVVLDTVIIYCDEPKLGKFGADDLLYGYLTLSKEVGTFSIKGMYENNTPMPNSSYEGGHMFSVGVSRNDLFLHKKMGLGTSLSPVYDTGNFGLSSGVFLRGNVSLSWELMQDLQLVFPQVNYYVPITVQDSRTARKTILAGFSYQF